ncbi:Uncharacterised protein [Bordetella holmesii]|nr:Uncharacterised protein [Bordetella holmesii]
MPGAPLSASVAGVQMGLIRNLELRGGQWHQTLANESDAVLIRGLIHISQSGLFCRRRVLAYDGPATRIAG